MSHGITKKISFSPIRPESSESAVAEVHIALVTDDGYTVATLHNYVLVKNPRKAGGYNLMPPMEFWYDDNKDAVYQDSVKLSFDGSEDKKAFESEVVNGFEIWRRKMWEEDVNLRHSHADSKE